MNGIKIENVAKFILEWRNINFCAVLSVCNIYDTSSTEDVWSSSNYSDHDKGIMDSQDWIVYCSAYVRIQNINLKHYNRIEDFLLGYGYHHL